MQPHSVRSDPSSASVVQKAFCVLGAFESRRLMTMSDVVRATGMPKSTVHRMLGMLASAGAIEREGTAYRVTMRITSIGASSKESVARSVAMPYLLDLHRTLKSTLHLGALRGTDVIYLEKLHAPGTPVFATAVGMSLPAHCTAVGKALLAYTEGDVAERYDGTGLRRLTNRSLYTIDSIVDELAAIRDRGVSTDIEEAAPGRSCIALPVMLGGAPILAVSVGFPTGTTSMARVRGPLGAAVASIRSAVSARLPVVA